MNIPKHQQTKETTGPKPIQAPPKCEYCNDTGFVDYWDSLGDLRGYTYCHCERGDEQERVWSPQYRTALKGGDR